VAAVPASAAVLPSNVTVESVNAIAVSPGRSPERAVRPQTVTATLALLPGSVVGLASGAGPRFSFPPGRPGLPVGRLVVAGVFRREELSGLRVAALSAGVV